MALSDGGSCCAHAPLSAACGLQEEDLDSDTYSQSYSDAYDHPDGFGCCYADRNSFAHPHPDTQPNADAYPHPNTDAYAYSRSNCNASLDATHQPCQPSRFPRARARKGPLSLNYCDACHSVATLLITRKPADTWARFLSNHRDANSGDSGLIMLTMTDADLQTLTAYIIANFNPDVPAFNIPPGLLQGLVAPID